MDAVILSNMGRALIGSDVLTPDPNATAPVPPEAPQSGGAAPEPSNQAESFDPMWAPPSSPGTYQFDRFSDELALRGMEWDMQRELDIRHLFHSEGVPPGIASEVMRQAAKLVINPPTPVQRELDRRSAQAELEKRFGADSEKILSAARQEVKRLNEKDPTLLDFLDETGLGNSVWLIVTLHTHAVARGRA